MKAIVAAFNQEKALVVAFSMITNLRMDIFEALIDTDGVCRTLLSPDCTTHNNGDITGKRFYTHYNLGHKMSA